MSKIIFFSVLLFAVISWSTSGAVFHASHPSAWGFFGHRKINRQAVFSLPPEMIVFFKKNIDYLTEHAIDPDMRRYASRFEAPRHFLDLDRYGEPPFPNLPRRWEDALFRYAEWYFINEKNDTIDLFQDLPDSVFQHPEAMVELNPRLFRGEAKSLTIKALRSFFHRNIFPKYYEDAMTAPRDSLAALLGEANLNCTGVWVKDPFSEHGTLPYNLERTMNRLTDAMRERNALKILRHAADIGHYIADAHVPLHTTRNYNGQLTGQDGIHAFWESRLPELFAEEEYDFWVGRAEVVEKPQSYFWNIILKSHTMVDSVLGIEQSLRRSFPADRQICTEQRGTALVKIQCEEFSAAYHKRLGTMVEDRLREAILAVGNVWYTCWVDAGQPDLNTLVASEGAEEDQQEKDSLSRAFRLGKIFGRPHD